MAFGFFKSTVGKKYLMGLTGLVWAGFILGHMAGNLLMFISGDVYNSYGHAITSGGLIYVVEAALILSLLIHVKLAIQLTAENRKSRGVGYRGKASGTKKVSLASRTMVIQGTVILAFIILHLITFKYGPHYETTVNGVPMRDLFKLVVEVFQNPIYVVWYLVALALLMAHLSHGFGSVFQSFGFLDHGHRGLVKMASWTYAVLVAGGFMAQPIYVFLAR